MALMFHRRLAIPVWAIAFLMVALAAPPPGTLLLMPPTTLLVIALAGIAVLVLLFTPRHRDARGCDMVSARIQTVR